jgi:hypothetical protein
LEKPGHKRIFLKDDIEFVSKLDEPVLSKNSDET